MQCETKKFKQNIAKEEAPVGQMVLSWYLETEKEKEGIEIKEKNHTMRDAEISMRSSRGGRSVEVGGRCRLMEAVWGREKEREWWRRECERDGGVMVW